MQTRSNALTQRGGDTVVMERVAEELRALGHTVQIDVEGVLQPRDFDLVHLYNFSTPDITEKQARRCVEQKVPFVVTTMYEDWPFFFNPMAANYMLLERYVHLGQPASAWNEMAKTIKNIPPAEIQRNDFTAAHAGALIPTGEHEKAALLRDYPNTKRVEIYHCGCDVSAAADDGSKFRKEYGVSDFVLCVGRLEWRKNQIMLLKALEESDLPIVFLTGGFTYQPQYEEVARRFKRKGRTHFIGKVSPEMLASAFAASRCHVLPSWYELPGLVNIEAARYGTNIVVTDYGTIRDYMGDDAFYCQPDEPTSIHDAVIAAYHAPRNERAIRKAEQFTWKRAALRKLEIYEKVLADYGYVHSSTSTGVSSFSGLTPLRVTKESLQSAYQTSAQARDAVTKLAKTNTSPMTLDASHDEAIEQANQTLRSGAFDDAMAMFRGIAAQHPRSLRAYRGMGVAALTVKRYPAAIEGFEKALEIEPSDAASRTGLASAYWNSGRKELGLRQFEDVLRENPGHLPTLTVYVGACLELGRVAQLEDALVRYLDLNPESAEMAYCLAGCLYRQGKWFLASAAINQVAKLSPEFEGLEQLSGLIARRKPFVSEAPEESTVSSGSAGFQSRLRAAPSKGEAIVRSEVFTIEELIRRREYAEVLLRCRKLDEDRTLTKDERDLLSVYRGEAYACKGELDNAEREFNHLPEDSAFGHRAVSGRGIIAAERNNWPEAERLFRRALELHPTFDVALAGVGMCLSRRNDQFGAWSEFRRALEVNPENLRAVYGVIQLGYTLQKLPELENALERYLEFNPGNLSILYAHAGCCYAQGKSDVAREQLEKIRIFEPQHQLANELLERIQSESRSGFRQRAQ
ncbi:MAG: tetratricopeptide repeat protein [Deltaproteobacteria bacterium]|nr:tetratricopeptide repeat protein [Deltaproteobacteria bacterium]